MINYHLLFTSYPVYKNNKINLLLMLINKKKITLLEILLNIL
jgi:hypothetical protein